MLRWPAFSFQGTRYDLSHLHPKTVNYYQPAQGKNPARGYKVNVIFSLHCFTRGMENETPDPEMLYGDNRETRIFDLHRHHLSHQLPTIIDGLMTRKCFHTGHENFFTVNLHDEEGNTIDYEVYFTVSKASIGGGINLYVQSAYARDGRHSTNRPRNAKPIGFSVILYNTLNKKPIKAPK